MYEHKFKMGIKKLFAPLSPPRNVHVTRRSNLQHGPQTGIAPLQPSPLLLQLGGHTARASSSLGRSSLFNGNSLPLLQRGELRLQVGHLALLGREL